MLREAESTMPSPPLEEAGKISRMKKSPVKSTKLASRNIPAHRVSKRASNAGGQQQQQQLQLPLSPPDSSSTQSITDGSRQKRVWKACERCRMKKTKCDGEFPCKRCKDDGLICTAGKRRRTEFKQLPHGYAEVLENTQFALVATVQRLYSMVRSGQEWDLGEPDLNDRGQPIIHSIADKLGCIRPNNDIDLPVQSVFPEDEQGFAELASQLKAQHRHEESTTWLQAASEARHERASSDELDVSDHEDYRTASYSGLATSSTMTALSTPSLNHTSFDCYSPSDGLSSATSPTAALPPISFAMPMMAQPSMAYSAQYTLPSGAFGMDLLNEGVMESSFGKIKPHVVASPNSEVMMGRGDPMFSPSFDVLDPARYYISSAM